MRKPPPRSIVPLAVVIISTMVFVAACSRGRSSHKGGGRLAASPPPTAGTAGTPGALAPDPQGPTATGPMAVECPESVRALPFPPGFNAWDPRLNGEDLLVVMKSRRCVGLYSDGVLRGGPDGGAASCWRVALGAHVGGKEPTGPKEAEGDLRTPEGWYRTSDKPRSRFFHAIRVHYPNLQDADRALATGRIDQLQHDAIRDALASDDVPPQGTPLGGEVLLHGGGSSADWTLGSIALEDDDIDELRALLPAQMRTDLLILP